MWCGGSGETASRQGYLQGSKFDVRPYAVNLTPKYVAFFLTVMTWFWRSSVVCLMSSELSPRISFDWTKPNFRQPNLPRDQESPKDVLCNLMKLWHGLPMSFSRNRSLVAGPGAAFVGAGFLLNQGTRPHLLGFHKNLKRILKAWKTCCAITFGDLLSVRRSKQPLFLEETIALFPWNWRVCLQRELLVGSVPVVGGSGLGRKEKRCLFFQNWGAWLVVQSLADICNPHDEKNSLS